MDKKVGVISDTHGLVRPQALAALRGSDLIIHAGDVGRATVLESLAEIAPVKAVRGNMDGGSLAWELPRTRIVEVEEVRFFVIHYLQEMDIDPVTAGIRVVISGHSHSPSLQERNGVIFLNPGSAGPRRFKLPISLALVTISRGTVQARFVGLET